MAKELSLPEVPHKSLRAAAYAAIREAIVSGALRPGQRLVEVELAQQLGISRAPVREALRQLETEGLVIAEPHRGAHVADLSQQDLWEIYTLRAAVEGLAVRLVASDPQPEVVQELERLVGRMRTAAARGRRRELSRFDIQFHETICKAAKHGRLLEAWRGMQARVRMFVSMTSQYRLPLDQVVRYHEEVLEAIRRGDPGAAEALLTDHILTVGENIVAVFEKTERDPSD